MPAAAGTLRKPELVCPAGSLRALTIAVDAGADAVYMGLRDATNARNFAGLNFDLAATREGMAYIALSAVALKYGRTRRTCMLALIAAALLFAYVVGTAPQRDRLWLLRVV